MEVFASQSRAARGRGLQPSNVSDRGGGRAQSRNKTWVSPEISRAPSNGAETSTQLGADADRWERGGHRGSRGRGNRNRGGRSSRSPLPDAVTNAGYEQNGSAHDADVGDLTLVGGDIDEPELKTLEERELFFKELVKARELERITAIKEGKLDDPNKRRRLSEAITVVGTCRDMCPRFERYRRERENNLFEWEIIPGTRRVDHKKAVKMFERAVGDKIVPSDLRPPPVLKRTLDYLFHQLMPMHGFSATYNFVRDRSRAVRNDFTLQFDNGPLAVECNERCARFHILALHVQRGVAGYSGDLDEHQLMNSLQSLKEFYPVQRERDHRDSPHELELRIYHRLAHMRDQVERHEEISDDIQMHPVFLLTTRFRERVQEISSPIRKKSPLKVDATAMGIFAELVGVLREQRSAGMIYLVACILEWHFGQDTIEDIESIRGDLSYAEIIDGEPATGAIEDDSAAQEADEEEALLSGNETNPEAALDSATSKLGDNPWPSAPLESSGAFGLQASTSPFAPVPASTVPSAFTGLTARPNPFQTSASTLPSATTSPFGLSTSSPFGTSAARDAFGRPMAAFGASSAPAAPPPQEVPFHSMSASSSAPSFSAAPAAQLPGSFQPSASLPVGISLPTAPASVQKQSFTSSPAPPLAAETNSAPPQGTSLGARLNPQAPTFTPPSSITISTSSADTPRVNTSNGTESSTPTSTSNKRPVLTPLNTTPPPLPQSKSAKIGDVPRLSKEPSISHPSDLAVSSPMLPEPPSPQLQTISLPGTPTVPTANTPINGKAPMPLFPLSATSSFSQNSQQESILSPLVLTGPSFSRASFSAGPGSLVTNRPLTSSLSRKPSLVSDSPLKNGIPFPTNESIPHSPSPFTKPIPAATSATTGKPDKGKGKEKTPEKDLDRDTEDATLVAKADTFVMKRPFRRWARKTAYKGAVKRAEQYTRRRRMSTSSEGSDSRKRKGSSVIDDGDVSMAEARRARRRVSSRFQPARTDEDLARRLQENREQHERRWAPGTFLQAVRDHVVNKAGTYPFDYRIWLSMNESSDATAIWLEKKFDVPESGTWLSERVFSIPLLPNDTDSTSPGLIVFECSPTAGVDEVERKYRVLDDYARLTEIIKALPADRHFVPSLLLIIWADHGSADVPVELDEDIKKLESTGSLQSRTVFAVTATSVDLDDKFTNSLDVLDLDVSGGLVDVLTPRDLLAITFAPFKDFVGDWHSRAIADGGADWELLSAILRVAVELLNRLSRHLTECVMVNASDREDPLPPMEISVSTYNALHDSISTWLDHPKLRLHSHDCHASLDRLGLSAGSFFDALLELATKVVLAAVPGGSEERYTVSKTDLAGIKQDTDKDVAIAAEQLRAVFAFHVWPVQRTPKRRSLGDDESSISSRAIKKARISFSADEAELVNGSTGYSQGGSILRAPTPPSQSLSPALSAVTVTDDNTPQVTVAMLRALSKNVLRSRHSRT